MSTPKSEGDDSTKRTVVHVAYGALEERKMQRAPDAFPCPVSGRGGYHATFVRYFLRGVSVCLSSVCCARPSLSTLHSTCRAHSLSCPKTLLISSRSFLDPVHFSVVVARFASRSTPSFLIGQFLFLTRDATPHTPSLTYLSLVIFFFPSLFLLIILYTHSFIAMGLLRRGVTDDVTNNVIGVSETFTSYDKCKFSFIKQLTTCN